MEQLSDKIVWIRREPATQLGKAGALLKDGVKSAAATVQETAFERPSLLAIATGVAKVGGIVRAAKNRAAAIRTESWECAKGMALCLIVLIGLFAAYWWVPYGAYPITLMFQGGVAWMYFDYTAKRDALLTEGIELQEKTRGEVKKTILLVFGVDFTTRAMVKAYFKKYHPTEKESTVADVCDIVTGEEFLSGLAFTAAMVIGFGPIDSMLRVLKVKTMFGMVAGLIPALSSFMKRVSGYLVGSDADRSRGHLTGVHPRTFLRMAIDRMRDAPEGTWRHKFWSRVIRYMPRSVRVNGPADVADAVTDVAPKAIVTGIGLYAAYRTFYPASKSSVVTPKVTPDGGAAKVGDTMEAKKKALGKGKGKGKGGRGTHIRATGARGIKVRMNMRKRMTGAGGPPAPHSAVKVFWYEDDQVEVYDPITGDTETLRANSARIADIQRRANIHGMGNKVSVYNLRTNETLYGDGHIDVLRFDRSDDVTDEEWLAQQEQEEWDNIHGGDEYYDDDGDDFALEATRKAQAKEEEPEEEKDEAIETTAPTGEMESKLGKSSLSDKSLVVGRVVHPSMVKDGAEPPGSTMNAFVVGQKVLIMKHWLENCPKAGAFVFELGDQSARIAVCDCIPVSVCPRGELVAFQKPPKMSMASSKIRLDEPPRSESECLVRSFHKGHDKSETACGKLLGGFKHTCATENGWCGSPVVRTGEHQPAVVGLHYLGDGGDGTNGYIPFTSDLIRYMKENGFPGNGK
jgi:hypothetical protein